MIKKLILLLFLCMCTAVCAPDTWAADNTTLSLAESLDAKTNNTKYGKRLTSSERDAICERLKSMRNAKLAESTKDKGNASNASISGGGIIPDAVLNNIYSTIKQISDATALVMVLGHALTCHAVHAEKQSVTILKVTLFSYPNIPVWMCGAIIYFVGFMLTLSVTFYLVDIAFKLGFAVIMLPIGIALWPFPPTKNKLTIIVSIILKNAAIFTFLALTVSYALNLLDKASVGLNETFIGITASNTDIISKRFSLASKNFLIILFALVYGLKLVGSTISDYVDQFFPDKAFGGGKSSSPIHGSMTQAMDFAKKKVVAPVASFAKDVAKTQMGRATVGVGKTLSGAYNPQIRKAAQRFKNNAKQAIHYARHPSEAVHKGAQSTGKLAGDAFNAVSKSASRLLTGTLGRIVLGKQASKDLQNRIDAKIDQKTDAINKFSGKAAQAISKPFVKLEKKAREVRDKVVDTAKKVKKKIDNRVEKFKQTKVGRGMIKTRNAVQNGARKIAQPIKQTYNGTKKLYNNVKAKYNGAIETLDKAQASINKFRSAWSKKVHNVQDKVYRKIYTAKQATHRFINKIYVPGNALKKALFRWADTSFAKDENDSIMKSVRKAVARGSIKGVGRLVGGAINAPLGLVAEPLKIATSILSGTLNTATTITGGVFRAPVNIGTAIIKAPIKGSKIVLKALNVSKVAKSTIKGTGDVLTRVGENMQKNYKEKGYTNTEETEWEKEERLREELEEKRRLNKTWE